MTTNTMNANTMTGPPVTTGRVTSKDGTTIGFRRLGSGPAVVVVDGTMISSKSHLGLARALAGDVTVYLPDRRGRGLSGPYGRRYCMQREVEDLEAMLDHTGAQRVFGISSGALICMRTALTRPDVTKLALYEPALLVGPTAPVFSTTRLDREIAEGKIAGALITGMLESQIGPPVFNHMPRFLLERLTKLAMKAEEKKAGADDVTMRMLAPTMHYDFQIIHEANDAPDLFQDPVADVLLIGGSKSPAYFGAALAALESAYPGARRIELPGLDHGGSTDRDGKPELLAPELLQFFAGRG